MLLENSAGPWMPNLLDKSAAAAVVRDRQVSTGGETGALLVARGGGVNICMRARTQKCLDFGLLAPPCHTQMDGVLAYLNSAQCLLTTKRQVYICSNPQRFSACGTLRNIKMLRKVSSITLPFYSGDAAFAVSRGGTKLAAVIKGAVFLYDVAAKRSYTQSLGGFAICNAVCFSSDGNLLLVALHLDSVQVFCTTRVASVRRVPLAENFSAKAIALHDNTLVLRFYNLLEVRELSTMRLIRSLPQRCPCGTVLRFASCGAALAFAPNGETFVSVDGPETTLCSADGVELRKFFDFALCQQVGAYQSRNCALTNDGTILRIVQDKIVAFNSSGERVDVRLPTDAPKSVDALTSDVSGKLFVMEKGTSNDVDAEMGRYGVGRVLEYCVQ